MKTRRQATDAARKVRALMSEPATWTVRVWENLGWHCMLLRGPLQLYTSDGKAPFHCLLDDDPEAVPPMGGACHWTDHFYSDDPNEAVEHQLEAAREYFKQISQVLILAEGKKKVK